MQVNANASQAISCNRFISVFSVEDIIMRQKKDESGFEFCERADVTVSEWLYGYIFVRFACMVLVFV